MKEKAGFICRWSDCQTATRINKWVIKIKGGEIQSKCTKVNFISMHGQYTIIK